MLNISSITPAKPVGVITLNKPILGLGVVTDVEGNKWDIGAFGGNSKKKWASACPLNQLHPYFSDTSGRSYRTVFQKWKAYEVKIVRS